MSGAVIRPFRREDAGAAAELLAPMRAADDPVTADGILFELDAIDPADLAFWVAEAGGQIVGWAESTIQINAPRRDTQRVWAAVRPDHRRRGLGTRLFDTAEERALARRPRTLRSWASSDETDGVRMLRARGYEQRRTERLWSLDIATADLSELERRERDAAAAGYRVVPLRELIDRPRDLHRVFNAIDLDVPSDVERGGIPYEQWRRLALDDPLLDLDGSVIVLAGEEPVGMAWLAVDHERRRAANMFTGTVREHRHRSLARLAKLTVIRWAAANGIREIGTGNDSTNRDILALNEHLGYRQLPDFLGFARALEPIA